MESKLRPSWTPGLQVPEGAHVLPAVPGGSTLGAASLAFPRPVSVGGESCRGPSERGSEPSMSAC